MFHRFVALPLFASLDRWVADLHVRTNKTEKMAQLIFTVILIDSCRHPMFLNVFTFTPVSSLAAVLIQAACTAAMPLEGRIGRDGKAYTWDRFVALYGRDGRLMFSDDVLSPGEQSRTLLPVALAAKAPPLAKAQSKVRAVAFSHASQTVAPGESPIAMHLPPRTKTASTGLHTVIGDVATPIKAVGKSDASQLIVPVDAPTPMYLPPRSKAPSSLRVAEKARPVKVPEKARPQSAPVVAPTVISCPPWAQAPCVAQAGATSKAPQPISSSVATPLQPRRSALRVATITRARKPCTSPPWSRRVRFAARAKDDESPMTSDASQLTVPVGVEAPRRLSPVVRSPTTMRHRRKSLPQGEIVWVASRQLEQQHIRKCSRRVDLAWVESAHLQHPPKTTPGTSWQESIERSVCHFLEQRRVLDKVSDPTCIKIDGAVVELRYPVKHAVTPPQAFTSLHSTQMYRVAAILLAGRARRAYVKYAIQAGLRHQALGLSVWASPFSDGTCWRCFLEVHDVILTAVIFEIRADVELGQSVLMPVVRAGGGASQPAGSAAGGASQPAESMVRGWKKVKVRRKRKTSEAKREQPDALLETLCSDRDMNRKRLAELWW